MATSPSVTVVVVTWDGLPLLPACLNSLRRQLGVDAHVVVVDNGSTDGTSAWLAAHAPDVQVVATGRNRGFAGGANAGILASTSTYIALLNNDAEADPGWLTALVEVLDAPGNERVAAVTSRVLLEGRTLVNSTGNLVSRSGRGRDRDWRRPADHQRPPDEVFGFCGSAALLRRSAVEEVGCFDEDLFMYYEDSDMSWRLRAAGWTVHYQPSAVATHLHGISSGLGSPRFTLWNERNSMVVFTRHAPARLVVAMHMRRAAGLVLHTVRSPRSAVTRARWRAAAEHAGWLPRTLRQRRLIWSVAAVPRANVAQWLDRSSR